MATELPDLVLAGIKTATAASYAVQWNGSESTPRPADFVIVSDGESGHGLWDNRFSAPHIRALLPTRSGLTRKGREAGVRCTTLGRHSLSDNQQLLLVDLDDFVPMMKASDLRMVIDRTGDRAGSTLPANRSQWAIMLSRCCLTLGVVASAWSLRARAAAVR
jgi:hypothetical protein